MEAAVIHHLNALTLSDGLRENLQDGGDDQKYALNSKGKIVKVKEVGWGSPDDTPTHLCLQFASSFGTAFVGAVGTTFWIDNVKLVY